MNTLDAMVGHHSQRYLRFGWASARLDDVANWVPARVTAALTAVCAPLVTGADPRLVLRVAHPRRWPSSQPERGAGARPPSRVPSVYAWAGRTSTAVSQKAPGPGGGPGA